MANLCCGEADIEPIHHAVPASTIKVDVATVSRLPTNLIKPSAKGDTVSESADEAESPEYLSEQEPSSSQDEQHTPKPASHSDQYSPELVLQSERSSSSALPSPTFSETEFDFGPAFAQWTIWQRATQSVKSSRGLKAHRAGEQ